MAAGPQCLHSRVFLPGSGKLLYQTAQGFEGALSLQQGTGALWHRLETVREVAQRYGGQAEFTVEDGTFRASVFLPRTEAGRPEKAAPAENAPLSSLLDEAGMRFNLTPLDAAQLARLFSETGQEPSAPCKR